MEVLRALMHASESARVGVRIDEPVGCFAFFSVCCHGGRGEGVSLSCTVRATARRCLAVVLFCSSALDSFMRRRCAATLQGTEGSAIDTGNPRNQNRKCSGDGGEDKTKAFRCDGVCCVFFSTPAAETVCHPSPLPRFLFCARSAMLRLLRRTVAAMLLSLPATSTHTRSWTLVAEGLSLPSHYPYLVVFSLCRRWR